MQQIFVNLHLRFAECLDHDPAHPGSYWATVHATAEDARDRGGPGVVATVPFAFEVPPRG